MMPAAEAFARRRTGCSAGTPLLSTRACTVQVKVAPAASESCGVRTDEHGRRSAAELRLEAGAVGQRGGDDGPRAVDRGDVHGGAAVAGGRDRAGGQPAGQRGRAAGDGVDDGDAAGGARSEPRAVTVKGIGTPMGTVFMGAVSRVSASPVPES